jgi:hypothetical protein
MAQLDINFFNAHLYLICSQHGFCYFQQHEKLVSVEDPMQPDKFDMAMDMSDCNEIEFTLLILQDLIR